MSETTNQNKAMFKLNSPCSEGQCLRPFAHAMSGNQIQKFAGTSGLAFDKTKYCTLSDGITDFVDVHFCLRIYLNFTPVYTEFLLLNHITLFIFFSI